MKRLEAELLDPLAIDFGSPTPTWRAHDTIGISGRNGSCTPWRRVPRRKSSGTSCAEECGKPRPRAADSLANADYSGASIESLSE